jgi:hypothetical protein
MYFQVDLDRRSYSLLIEIVDHKCDGKAVRKDDGFELTKSGQRRPRQTTQGWKLLVTWKDGSTSWVPLKNLKASFPMEVAEYALVNKIIEEPAFAWWANCVLRKCNRIIKKVKRPATGTVPTNMGSFFPNVSMKLSESTKKQGLTSGRRPSKRK